MPETTACEGPDAERKRLRDENDRLRSLIHMIGMNTHDSDKLNLEQARWKLKVINQMTEGMA